MSLLFEFTGTDATNVGITIAIFGAIWTAVNYLASLKSKVAVETFNTVKAELKAEIAEQRHRMDMMELRLQAKVEKSDIADIKAGLEYVKTMLDKLMNDLSKSHEVTG